MRLWVDADSFPRSAKEIVYKAGRRTGSRVILVANRDLGFPPLVETDPMDNHPEPSLHPPIVCQIVVPKGDDVADEAIFDRVNSEDLVFTRDIVFAGRLVEKGIVTLNDRGDVFNAATIRERLSIRDFMAGMREAGLAEAGWNQYGPREARAFAAALDKELSRKKY